MHRSSHAQELYADVRDSTGQVVRASCSVTVLPNPNVTARAYVDRALRDEIPVLWETQDVHNVRTVVAQVCANPRCVCVCVFVCVCALYSRASVLE